MKRCVRCGDRPAARRFEPRRRPAATASTRPLAPRVGAPTAPIGSGSMDVRHDPRAYEALASTSRVAAARSAAASRDARRRPRPPNRCGPRPPVRAVQPGVSGTSRMSLGSVGRPPSIFDESTDRVTWRGGRVGRSRCPAKAVTGATSFVGSNPTLSAPIARPWPGDRRVRSPGCAERVGFEPTDPCGSTTFKAVAFVHSATAPGRTLRR